MKYLILIIATSLCVSCISIKADVTTDDNYYYETDQNLAEAGIRLVMEAQEKAWNNHDLEGFMDGYWKSDQLKFYGASGLTLGWDQTLQNYKKRYPSKAETGILRFEISDINQIEDDNYWVMGAYHLERDIGNADGVFMIIFKKINGEWKIVADMSC